MPNVSAPEIILLLLLALLLFGAKRLPEIGRSLGRGMREFKESVTGNDVEPERIEPDRVELPRPATLDDTVGTTAARERDTVS